MRVHSTFSSSASALRPPVGMPSRPSPPALAAIPTQVMQVLRLAGSNNPEGRWKVGTDISHARNAHFTNTVVELRAALEGPYDWFECDVRRRGGHAFTAHSPLALTGMQVREWLDVVARSGRGMKFDIKEAGALAETLRLIQESGIDDRLVIMNVTPRSRWRRQRMSAEQLMTIRRAVPRAIVNVDPGPPPYTDAVIDRAIEDAAYVGGPVMFPLDARFVTASIVARFRRAGRVAIWNDPKQFDPGDVAAATRRLRAIGVDGMIDLRRPGGPSSPAGRA